MTFHLTFFHFGRRAFSPLLYMPSTALSLARYSQLNSFSNLICWVAICLQGSVKVFQFLMAILLFNANPWIPAMEGNHHTFLPRRRLNSHADRGVSIGLLYSSWPCKEYTPSIITNMLKKGIFSIMNNILGCIQLRWIRNFERLFHNTSVRG